MTINPVCDNCKIRMKKKGNIKIGDKRFFCSKCGSEK